MALKPEAWPPLPLDSWRDTYATLHMWTQIVGKVCLALTPRVNHFWNVTFHIGSRGLTTPALFTGDRVLTMTFDFVAHELVIASSDGRREALRLQPQTVAAFYQRVMDALRRIDVDVRIWRMPVEIPDPIRFDLDEQQRSYDPDAAHTFWRVLVAINPVLAEFRAGFIGKCSPVHFFWGGFDLAVTRFSGRRAPDRPGADSVTRESYSHEVVSHGFWPGGGVVGDSAFYAYAAPEPAGFRTATIRPSAASYNFDLGEYLLPYEAIRTAPAPAAELTAFLSSTYDAAATLARWDRAELERR
jgi:uncharacterized protein DUF5996